MDVQDKLTAWAEWSNRGAECIGYKSLWQAIFDSAPVIDGDYTADQKNHSISISDEYASLIDNAVCEICNESPVLGEVIKRRYLRKNTLKEIAIYYLSELSGSRVSAKMAGVLLNHAHEAAEIQIDLLERLRSDYYT